MTARSRVGFRSQIFADLSLHHFPVDSFTVDEKLIQPGVSLRPITNWISAITVSAWTVAVPISFTVTITVTVTVTDWITVSF